MARRRRSSFDLRSALLIGGVVVAGVAGVALLGSSLGWFEPDAPRRMGVPEGTVAVPAAAVSIPTYSRVRLEHLLDSRTGDLLAVYLPEGSILPETFVDAKAIVGRVLAVDKQPGQLFSEHDFYPPGTREGIVAGIPAGKRAMRIDTSKVNGIVGLGRGDRFDLVATRDMARAAGRNIRVQGGAMKPMQSETIVMSGVVVQPLESRTLPGRNALVMEEIVIAVAPDEVAALSEALHTGARVDCVPRSGRPAEVAEGASDEADERARSNRSLSMIETITGGDRRTIAVRPGAEPLPSVSTAGDR